MNIVQGRLAVERAGKDLEVGNGCISLRLVLRDGGYAREFYGLDSKGQPQLLLSSIHKNLIPSSEHRACSSPMIAGERTHLFGVCRESLRMVYSDVEIRKHDQDNLVVRLTGAVPGHNLACEITLTDGSSAVHVVVEDDFASGAGDPVLEYLMSSYAFMPGGRLITTAEDLDYAWVPLVRPGNDHVIGDCAFHSPVAMVQQESSAAALVPDMAILRENRAMPCALDLDLNNGLLFTPLLSYGFCGYEQVDEDRYCRHDLTMSRRLTRRRLVYGYYLILDANCKKRPIYRQIARFSWPTRTATQETQPVAPERRLQSVSREVRDADAQAAYGLHVAATTAHREDMLRQSRAIKDAVLSAPQDRGLFPTFFDPEQQEWRGCRVMVDESRYSTAECSTQLYWLLKWHSRAEPDSRIIPYCRAYADRLIEAQLRSGAIPSWFDRDHAPLSALRSSAQTAASALFLTELAKATGLRRYARASERSARFVLDLVSRGAPLLDHTCMDSAAMRSYECADPHTGVSPRTTAAMVWIARMCLGMHDLLGEKAYIDRGLEILDQICLVQSVHERPWEKGGGAYGLCATGNIQARYDAELSAEFGQCAVRYGALTGKKEYFERGAAALRAAAAVEDPAPVSLARIAASAAEARRDFGLAYVHVRGKWAVGVLEARVRKLDFGRGSVRIELGAHSNGNGAGRVVFGGMRGSAYRVCVNGHCLTYSKKEMERGIQVPASESQPEEPRQPVQGRLF